MPRRSIDNMTDKEKKEFYKKAHEGAQRAKLERARNKVNKKAKMDFAQLIGDCIIPADKLPKSNEELTDMGLPQSEHTYLAAVVSRLYHEAIKGNIRAIEDVMKLNGIDIQNVQAQFITNHITPLIDLTDRPRPDDRVVDGEIIKQ